jgi:hypothetical protein
MLSDGFASGSSLTFFSTLALILLEAGNCSDRVKRGKQARRKGSALRNIVTWLRHQQDPPTPATGVLGLKELELESELMSLSEAESVLSLLITKTNEREGKSREYEKHQICSTSHVGIGAKSQRTQYTMLSLLRSHY